MNRIKILRFLAYPFRSLFSALIVFIPYFIFNSGVVFELAKMKPVGFIDVPYSIALSSSRVDIATVFDKEDVEAAVWLKQLGDSKTMYGDAHGTKLLIQYFGVKMVESTRSLMGDIQVLNKIGTESDGYIFLRKWNLDTNQITIPGDYGSRISYDLDEMEVLKEKIEGGTVIFDNGARIILIDEK